MNSILTYCSYFPSCPVGKGQCEVELRLSSLDLLGRYANKLEYMVFGMMGVAQDVGGTFIGENGLVVMT